MKDASLLLLPGDGIGPEVVVELRKVIDWFGNNRGYNFNITEDDLGGAAYERYGKPLADENTQHRQIS